MTLRLKRCGNMHAKKLPFVIIYVPDWCKTQQTCDKAVLFQKMVKS